jgi:hypothetical protein
LVEDGILAEVFAGRAVEQKGELSGKRRGEKWLARLVLILVIVIITGST